MPDLRALRVAQTTSQLIAAKHLKQQPVWLPTVTRNPPSTDLSRKPPPSTLRSSRPSTRQRTAKVRRLFDPQNIKYAEDSLRQQFYAHHPWELARPRQILENDALDYTRCDWSRLQQSGLATTGESVVQRTRYLMTHDKEMGREAAYRMACAELYRIRRQEAMEKRIAMEEGLAFGARFNKTETQVALELEAEVLRKWREKALYAKSLQKGSVSAPSTTTTTGALASSNVDGRDQSEGARNTEDGETAEERDVLDDLLP